jgi:effector-binding domain-containing protein
MEVYMKFLKILGIVIMVLIVIIAILGFVAPKSYDVERSTIIDAPRELVYNHVKFWRNWSAWSPWAVQDPEMQVTVEGVDGEEGSSYNWQGDPEMTGKGAMTNTGIKEFEEISYHLHFMEPWESESDGYVRLSEVEAGTMVVWGFYGETPFPWNIFMLFASMDKMIGGDFDKGLTLLKGIVENEYARMEKIEIKQAIFPAKNYAAVRDEVGFSDMQSFYATSFTTLMQAMEKSRVRMIGLPTGIYFTWDQQQMTTDMAAALPVRGNLKGEGIEMIHIPAQTAYMVDYYGSYELLNIPHQALELYLTQSNLKTKPPAIEEYVTDPTAEPDTSKWLTKIYYFVE